MLVFGGFDGDQAMHDLYVLDTATLIWTQLDLPGGHPLARSGAACALMGPSRIYMMGGYCKVPPPPPPAFLPFFLSPAGLCMTGRIFGGFTQGLLFTRKGRIAIHIPLDKLCSTVALDPVVLAESVHLTPQSK